jgi:hypothetical protein
MISFKRCNEGPRVVLLMCGGDRLGTDRDNEGKQTQQWVRKSPSPILAFDPWQEKDTYQRVRKEVLEKYLGASTSTTPHEEDHTIP